MTRPVKGSKNIVKESSDWNRSTDEYKIVHQVRFMNKDELNLFWEISWDQYNQMYVDTVLALT